MNTYEIAEAIDELIQLRIKWWSMGCKPLNKDRAEILKRIIADGIREYSRVPGVAVDNRRDDIYHHYPKATPLNPLKS